MKAPRRHSEVRRRLTTQASLAFNGCCLATAAAVAFGAGAHLLLDRTFAIGQADNPPIRSAFPILPAPYNYRIGKDETS
jgi:hypothetical protein